MSWLRLLAPLLLGGITWLVLARLTLAWGPPSRVVTLADPGRGPAARRPLRRKLAAGRALPPTTGRSPPMPRGAVLFAGAAVLGASPIGLPVAALASVAALGALRARRWAARRRRQEALAADLPEVVDLLTVAVGAGLTVRDAVQAVARRGRGPLAHELAAVVADAEAGRPFADALDDLPERAGEPTRALAGSLAGCVRYGTPVGPTLVALGVEARDAERRRAEQRARRVPVLLLFPLVLCILPAFALLTVAPLLADALRALRL